MLCNLYEASVSFSDEKSVKYTTLNANLNVSFRKYMIQKGVGTTGN